MGSMFSFRKFKEQQNTFIIFVCILVGILFKMLALYFKHEFLDYLSNLLLTGFAVGLVVDFFSSRKEEVVLREVIGISGDDSLINSIRSIVKEIDYITEKRISVWNIKESNAKKSKNKSQKYDVENFDTHDIRIVKEGSDFYFRRGYDINNTLLKNIELKNGKSYERIDCSDEFNQHILKQKHGSHLCFTLTNLNFIKNLKYSIRINTLFKTCMEKDRDYLSVDFLNSTSSTNIIVHFPFEIRDLKGKNIYAIDVKIRSLTNFKGYIMPKYIKSNGIIINYNKPLEGGDSIVIFYEKIKKSTS